MRKILTFFVSLFVFLVFIGPSGMANATYTQQNSESKKNGMDQFGACISGGGIADMVMLFDVSSSLQNTDPTDARVDSAVYLLEELTQSTGKTAGFNIMISTFADDYRNKSKWTKIEAGSKEYLKSQIVELKRDKDGFETDYLNALEGARADLNQRARTVDADKTHCHAVVMFTDGKLDIGTRDNQAEIDKYQERKPYAPDISIRTEEQAKKVIERAQAEICRKGGTVDQLAADKVSVLGVGLSPDNAPADFSLLQRMIESKSSDGQTCGSGKVLGKLYTAKDINELLFAFDKISDTKNAPLETEAGVCQREFCEQDGHKFVLDSSIHDIRILGEADIDGAAAAIKAPNGTKLDLQHQDENQEHALPAPFKGTYKWLTSKSVVLKLEKDKIPDSDWSGLWVFSFTDPQGTSSGKKSHANIHIVPLITANLKNADTLKFHTGEKLQNVRFALLNSDGSEYDANNIKGKATFTVEFSDKDGKTKKLFATDRIQDIASAQTLDLADLNVGKGILSLTLLITTADTKDAAGNPVKGTTLSPVKSYFPVDILAPAKFPSVKGDVRFIEKDKTYKGTLNLTGEGCVYVPSNGVAEITTAPQNISRVQITAAGHDNATNCLQVAGDAQMEVVLASEQAGNGVLHGSFPVVLMDKSGANASTLEVKTGFEADLAKPRNQGAFVGAFALTLLATLLLPVLVFYGIRSMTTKMSKQNLIAFLTPVTVSGEVLQRDGQEFAIRANDQSYVSVNGKQATVGNVRLKTRISLMPDRAGYVVVDDNMRDSLSNEQLHSSPSSLRAKLPLSFGKNWVILRDKNMPENQAELLVLLSATADQDAQLAYVEDVKRKAPALLRELVRAQQSKTAKQSGGKPNNGNGQLPGAQQNYPPAPQSYPPAQPGYPGAQQSYPPAQQSYPPAQQSYPPAPQGTSQKMPWN